LSGGTTTSIRCSDKYPLFPVEGKKVRRWVTEEQGDRLVAKSKAIKRCSDCTRNLTKANCMKIAGRKHNLEYQMSEGEGVSLDRSPNCVTDWDMEIYATGCAKMKSDWQQEQASPETIDSVKTKVNSFAYQWRA
jgi:hypothetical protein